MRLARFDGEVGSLGAREGVTGPEGKHRSPLFVAVAILATLGAYQWYWTWKTADSVSWFAPSRKSPFAIARWAVPVIVLVWAWGLIWAVVATVQAGAVPAELLPAGDALAGLLGGLVEPAGTATLETAYSLAIPGALVFGFLGLALIGVVGLVWTYWRIWAFVSDMEHQLGHVPRLSPALMLVMPLAVGGGLALIDVPSVVADPANLLVTGFVFFRTQRGLNRVWAAASRPESAADEGATGQQAERPGDVLADGSEVDLRPDVGGEPDGSE